jgi:hypothetical protein
MDWAEFTDLGALLTDERVERRLAADVAGYSCQRGGAIAPSVSEAAQKLWQQVAPRTPSDRVSEAGCVQR